MPTRLSQLFVRTLREDPVDAEVASHRLLVRAGYIRRQAPGIFAWLPLGLRVRRRIEAIIRETGYVPNPQARALALRRTLQGAERLDWVDTGRDDVLRFRRPGGWEVVTNFGDEPYALDLGDVLVASGELRVGSVPAATTVWFRG